MIEKLQQRGLYANYKIVSVYRSPDANKCVGAAKASKHLNNWWCIKKYAKKKQVEF